MRAAVSTYDSAERGLRWRRASDTELASTCAWNMPTARPRRKLWAATPAVSTPASFRTARDRRVNSAVERAADKSDASVRSSNNQRPKSWRPWTGTPLSNSRRPISGMGGGQEATASGPARLAGPRRSESRTPTVLMEVESSYPKP